MGGEELTDVLTRGVSERLEEILEDTSDEALRRDIRETQQLVDGIREELDGRD